MSYLGHPDLLLMREGVQLRMMRHVVVAEDTAASTVLQVKAVVHPGGVVWIHVDTEMHMESIGARVVEDGLEHASLVDIIDHRVG